MYASITLENGSNEIIDVKINEQQGKFTASIPKETISKKTVKYIDFLPDYLTAESTDSGYMVVTTGIHEGNFICYFKERSDIEYITNFPMMPIFGMKKGNESILAIVSGMACDFKLVVGVKGGKHYLYPRFYLDGDVVYEDIVVEYIQLHGAGYSEMARYYRNYQLSRGACVPLKERAANNPVLRNVVEGVEVRIRHGWKPSPSPVLYQTPENEPPMKVACDFKRVSEIVKEFKRQGIDKAEFCLVGWNSKGHDGRFPQHFPVEEALGGQEQLEEVVRAAKQLGYNMVCHTNSTCAYECADCFDEDFLLKMKDGSFMKGGSLSGGQRYYMCPRCAYERFAVTDLPRVAQLGFEGLHYIDVLTAEPAKNCYDKNHPVNRKQCVEWYNLTAKMSKELFGGFASEGPYDFLCSNTDYILYTTIVGKNNNNLIFDEKIPFWQLVYHGIILSNPGSDTVNYTLKGKKEQLKVIECGGRPLMYYYSKFGETKNWMGDIDLTCDTDEDLVKSVAYVRKAYEEYRKLSYLQYEYMEKHEKLSDNVYMVTYSDGTTITVDYNAGTYEMKHV